MSELSVSEGLKGTTTREWRRWSERRSGKTGGEKSSVAPCNRRGDRLYLKVCHHHCVSEWDDWSCMSSVFSWSNKVRVNTGVICRNNMMEQTGTVCVCMCVCMRMCQPHVHMQGVCLHLLISSGWVLPVFMWRYTVLFAGRWLVQTCKNDYYIKSLDFSLCKPLVIHDTFMCPCMWMGFVDFYFKFHFIRVSRHSLLLLVQLGVQSLFANVSRMLWGFKPTTCQSQDRLSELLAATHARVRWRMCAGANAVLCQ